MSPESTSELPDLDQRPATSRRIAWTIVIIMSALVVLALLAVIWGFVHQSQILLAARAARQAAPVDASNPGVHLAPGERIVSVNTEAGKMVMHVEGPAGGRIDIIDLATGKLTSQIRTSGNK